MIVDHETLLLTGLSDTEPKIYFQSKTIMKFRDPISLISGFKSINKFTSAFVEINKGKEIFIELSVKLNYIGDWGLVFYFSITLK